MPDRAATGSGAESPPAAPEHGRLPVTGLHWWEIADALWLARHHPGLAPPETRRPEPREAAETPDGSDEPEGPGRADRADAADSTEESGPGGTEGADPPDRTDAEELPMPLGDPGEPQQEAPGTEETREPEGSQGSQGSQDTNEETPAPRRWVRLRRAKADAFDSTSLGQALRPLRPRIRSAHRQELDEEGTAERLAEAPGLPPMTGPGSEQRWEAVLVVDTGPQMGLWQGTALRFAAVLRRHGGFRDLQLRSLDTRSETPEGVVLRGPGRHGRTQPPRSLVDPTGRRIVFVLTNGLAPAWRTGAAQTLLAQWARHQPVSVLHVLPQRLWHKTGLHPQRVRLRTSGPRPAGGQLDWEYTEPLIAALRGPDGGGRAVPVPVLEIAGDWLSPWARFVAGEGPRWTELAAVVIPPRPPEPTELPPRPKWTPVNPAERVARFRVWASPEAFDLATRLAAVPLDMPVISAVQRLTLPRTGPVHLAEFFMGDLVTPMPGHEEKSFLFLPGVRQELLASSTRQSTELASRIAAETLSRHSAAARELLGHFDGEDGEEPGEPEVTGENLHFREVEHLVLEALSGTHLHRARRIRSLIHAHVTSAQNSDTTTRSELDPAIFSEGSATVNLPGTPDTPAPAPQGGDGGSGAPQGGMTVTAVSQGAVPGSGVSLDRGPRMPSARPAILGNMPPRNLVFTGREVLLRRLERDLAEGPTAVLPHALHGMGGVGKSQLALEYVYRHASRYEIVWWIPAERPTQISQALVELSQRMHLPVTPEAITAVPAVLEALRTGNPYRNWLLVFDNAESPEAVQEFFPTSPEGGPSGSILVTSRNPQWNTLAHPLEVDVFDRSESIQLLQRRNPDLSTAEADQLADVLGDLPLAVEQASAWRAETGMPAAEYLRLFEEKKAELMTVSPPTQYEQTVATAWNVSLDHVASKNPAALQLLQVCAYFAPEPVSRSIFSGAAVEPIAPDLDRALTDPLRLGRAIREINRYSLAKIDHRSNSIQMHRLVQAVLIARMTEEQRTRMQRGAHLLLAANAPRNPSDPEHWARFADLYPHVVVSRATESDSRNVRQMVINVAQYLYFWGDHEGSRDFAQRAYEIWREKFGEDDQQTLLLCRNLWYVLWRMGRYREGAELSQRLLTVVQRLSSEGEEELLAVMGQIAADRRAQGDYRGALEIAREVQERAVRDYGEEDPLTLTHTHNLALNLRVCGHPRRAIELDEENWRRNVLLYGEEAYSSLLSEMAVALDRREAGEYAASAQMLEDLLEKHRRVFGEMNPHTLRATARLGASRRKAGDHASAIELSRYARKALTDRYGERSPDALVASMNLSMDLRHNGALEEARRMGQKARDLYADVFGTHHPDTVAADVNLAVTLRLLNKVDTARTLNESAVARAEAALGEAHPATLVCAVNLASDMFAQGDAAAAAELGERTLEALKVSLGEEHPTTLVAMSNLAIDLKALHRNEEAESLHAAALKDFQLLLGEAHPACADAAAWRRLNCDSEPLP